MAGLRVDLSVVKRVELMAVQTVHSMADSSAEKKAELMVGWVG